MTPAHVQRAAIISVLIAALPGVASAASFYLIESSASHMGNSFSGTASSADDASTVYFNSAGMARLDQANVQIGAHLVLPQAKFDNDGSTASNGSALSGPDDETKESAVVPNVYYVRPMNDSVTFGIGVNAPFGLESSYDDGWVGRYHATDSSIETVNVNPSVAIQATERLSVGFGINYQWADATLENEVDSFAACFDAATAPVAAGGGGLASGAANTACGSAHGEPGNRASDSSIEITGDDRSVGLDLGLLYEFDEDTRVGLSWREGVDYTLEGRVTFDESSSCAGDRFCNGATADGAVTANLELPDIIALSVTHGIGNNWRLDADVAWYGWDSIQRLRVVRPNGQEVTTLDLEYDNTMRYALGATYTGLESTTLRGGVALDESPVSSAQAASARIPDEDRTWVSVGATFALSDSSSVDVGYAHLMVDDARIDSTYQGHTLRGEFDPSVDILSVAANWRF